MTEADLQREVRLRIGQKPDTVLYRNQAGLDEYGWREVVRTALALLRQGRVAAATEALRSPNLRRAQSGLCKGASDLIGIVGPGGVWIALEVKSLRGRPTKEQKMFIALVNKLGGCAGVVRTLEEAETLWEQARCASLKISKLP